MDFTGCEAVFDSPVVTWDDDRMAYGELRINSYTERGDEPHIISLRKAEKHEVRYYSQAIAR